ncbi:MAG: two-component sensor histidine kinase [Rhodanobacter sp.]|nr:MAG: two-component sensor histidine kinase [Rhodanobacter sp.]TAM36574.1 MAG: two-component sensor histidine kinase [Rhodanobacter sp.]
MTPRSLRMRLLLLLIGSLVLAWGAMLAVGYDEVREEIHELADARLQQGARTLLALDLKRLTRLAQAGDGDAGNGRDHGNQVAPLAFQVWGGDQRLLLASPDAPAARFHPDDGYATRVIDARAWRSYSLRDARRGYQVTVLEPLALREHPVHEVAWRVGRVALWALPLLGVLVWLSVARGLAPLGRLARSVGTRDAGNLEPLHVQRIPAEAVPLVAALNGLLARLAVSLDRERTFTADAAHELRTPLAAIKVQAEVALGAPDAAIRQQAIVQVIAGVDRATHLAQQLLTLARLEHGGELALQAVDLGGVAAECLALRAGDADARGIAVDLQADPGCVVHGDPATLRILVDNLVDNAIKYGVSGGRLAVAVERHADAWRLTVADDGAGVPAADWPRLRDRFYRGADRSAAGSGLGLSIVERIAAAHHATVGIGRGIDGRGLAVSVDFPSASGAA